MGYAEISRGKRETTPKTVKKPIVAKPKRKVRVKDLVHWVALAAAGIFCVWVWCHFWGDIFGKKEMAKVEREEPRKSKQTRVVTQEKKTETRRHIKFHSVPYDIWDEFSDLEAWNLTERVPVWTSRDFVVSK